jgi:hypothetical protein
VDQAAGADVANGYLAAVGSGQVNPNQARDDKSQIAIVVAEGHASGRVLDQVGALEQRGAKLIGKGPKPPNSTDFGHQLGPVHHMHDLIDVLASKSETGQRKNLEA